MSEEKIYRVSIYMDFYQKADNEVMAKVHAMHRIKNKMVNEIKVEEVDLPDDLKKLYFGEKDDKP